MWCDWPVLADVHSVVLRLSVAVCPLTDLSPACAVDSSPPEDMLRQSLRHLGTSTFIVLDTAGRHIWDEPTQSWLHSPTGHPVVFLGRLCGADFGANSGSVILGIVNLSHHEAI